MVLNGTRMMSTSVMSNNVSSTPPKKKRMCRTSRSLEDFSKVIGSNGTLRRPLMSPVRNKYPVPDSKRSEPLKEDYDFEKQFGKGCFLDGGDDCTWLSSNDCLSMSSFFDQYKFLGSSQFVDEWLASLLSNWAKSVKSAIMDLDMSLNGYLMDEEAANWLMMPFEKDASVYSLTLSEDTTNSDNSSTQFSRDFDAQTQDLDGASFMFSLGNLDGEDYNKKPNMETYQLESFHSDGPHSQFLPRSSFGSSHLTELRAETLDFSPEVVSATADLKGEEGEPIFWPFEGKFESSAEETMKYLSMSPRKDVKARVTPRAPTSRKFEQGEGRRRKLQFESAGPKSWKSSASSPSVGKSTLGKSKTAIPSRMSRNLKKCAKVMAAAVEESVVPPKISTGSERDLLGEEDFASIYVHELPIEKLLGLPEFDGHEGVDAEFDGNVFLLD